MNKRFPMIDGPDIDLETAEKIYKVYSCLFSKSQSLQEIAKRGGFRWSEVRTIWREHQYNKKCKCHLV